MDCGFVGRVQLRNTIIAAITLAVLVKCRILWRRWSCDCAKSKKRDSASPTKSSETVPVHLKYKERNSTTSSVKCTDKNPDQKCSPKYFCQSFSVLIRYSARVSSVRRGQPVHLQAEISDTVTGRPYHSYFPTWKKLANSLRNQQNSVRILPELSKILKYGKFLTLSTKFNDLPIEVH